MTPIEQRERLISTAFSEFRLLRRSGPVQRATSQESQRVREKDKGLIYIPSKCSPGPMLQCLSNDNFSWPTPLTGIRRGKTSSDYAFPSSLCTKRAPLRVHVSQADGRLLLLDVQAAATRSPRVLTTSKGLTVSGKQEEAEKPVKKVTAEMKKTWVGRLQV